MSDNRPKYVVVTETDDATTAHLQKVSILTEAVAGTSLSQWQVVDDDGLNTFETVVVLEDPVAGLATVVATNYNPVSPEVTAFLDRTSGLDATHTDAYTALIDGLVADDIWTKLDALYIFATQNQATALLNLVSASHAVTLTGSPVFQADRGFTNADNGSKYQNTNLNASTAGGNYTQNSAHMSVWQVTYVDGNVTPGTVSGANRQYIIPDFGNGGTAYYRINTSGGVSGTVANGTGHALSNRSSSSNIEGYRNGVQIVSAADASVALNNANFTFPDLGVGIPESGQVAGGSFGGSLTSGEVTLFYNHLRTYMTAVGVP